MSNILNKSWTFLKEVRMQIKKIDWPTAKESFKYTLVVLFISFLMAGFLGGIDFGLSILLKNLIK